MKIGDVIRSLSHLPADIVQSQEVRIAKAADWVSIHIPASALTTAEGLVHDLEQPAAGLYTSQEDKA